jgi:hypothetical protein
MGEDEKMKRAFRSQRLFFAPIFVFCVISSHLARGHENREDRIPWDLSVKLGTSFGTITKESTSQVKNFGGFPIGLILNEDLSQKFLLSFQIAVVFDPLNNQLTRQGVDAVLAYHLFGGARLSVRDYDNVRFVSKNRFNLSLLLSTGFHAYSASSVSNPSDTLSGSVYETMGGLQYRYDFSEGSALVVEALHSLFNVSASNERLSPDLIEISLSWRFFL